MKNSNHRNLCYRESTTYCKIYLTMYLLTIVTCFPTTVLAFPIEEGSAKVRTGQPLDDTVDYKLPIWAGELPLKVTAGIPVADPKLNPEIVLPENLTNYRPRSVKS